MGSVRCGRERTNQRIHKGTNKKSQKDNLLVVLVVCKLICVGLMDGWMDAVALHSFILKDGIEVCLSGWMDGCRTPYPCTGSSPAVWRWLLPHVRYATCCTSDMTSTMGSNCLHEHKIGLIFKFNPNSRWISQFKIGIWDFFYFNDNFLTFF